MLSARLDTGLVPRTGTRMSSSDHGLKSFESARTRGVAIAGIDLFATVDEMLGRLGRAGFWLDATLATGGAGIGGAIGMAGAAEIMEGSCCLPGRTRIGDAESVFESAPRRGE